jgi:DNA-binding transcriptional LysR family regulator
MELRHLLYFKMVAEELHFRNAARKLFISQPPLSRQIRELEEELGTPLFDRSGKRVILTPAGQYFKKETEEILTRLEESRNRIKQIPKNLCGEFKIGYISSTYHPVLMNTLKEMRNVFPFLSIKLYEVSSQQQIKALEEGKLDIGIIRAPVASVKLKIDTLYEDPFLLVLPEGKQEFRDLAALGNYLSSKAFIFFNKDYAPLYHQKLLEICSRLGFQPEISHEANTVHSILRLVESGAGISILPRSIKEHYPYLKLSYFELKSLPIRTEVVLAYGNTRQDQALDWFVREYNSHFTKKQG